MGKRKCRNEDAAQISNVFFVANSASTIIVDCEKQLQFSLLLTLIAFVVSLPTVLNVRVGVTRSHTFSSLTTVYDEYDMT